MVVSVTVGWFQIFIFGEMVGNHQPLRKMAVYQDTDPQMPDSTSLVREKARLPNINCAVYRAELFFVAWRGNKN